MRHASLNTIGEERVVRISTWIISVVMCLLLASQVCAQHSCEYYTQNPSIITIAEGQTLEREVEIVFTNTGTSTWERTGGVSNLNYIELRSADAGGGLIDGALYHSSWINRQRVGSYLISQNGVAPGQRARFVFTIKANAVDLGIGTHECYFRPYHAKGGYIWDWGQTKITVVVSRDNQPPVGQVPVVTIDSVTPSSPVTQGQAVQFVGTANNYPDEYRWESNGHLVGTALGCNCSFTAGSYSIVFKARNRYGWSGSATYQLQVNSVSPPTPGTLTANITGVIVERTAIRSQSGTGSYVYSHNLVTDSSIRLRQYHVLRLEGQASGGTTSACEWSIEQNGVTRIVGNSMITTTEPDDLLVGQQTIKFRVCDNTGVWSVNASFQIEVDYWPLLKLPITGDWQRTGSDYNKDYHSGESAIGAQDWNRPLGGDTDFGLEIVASLPGVVKEVSSTNLGGRHVFVEFEDTLTGARFRCKFLHLSSVLVSQNEIVFQGQPIGLCGNTGTSSTSSHLHYVLQRWENDRWVSVIPEPVWINNTTVEQTISYSEQVWGINHCDTEEIMILREVVFNSVQSDWQGWGHELYWSATTDARQPTVTSEWNITIPLAGWWKVYTHNPTGVTHDVLGVSNHNTTNNAVFDVTRDGQLGTQTFVVDQGRSSKGELIEVTEFYAEIGDHVLIVQHNATGELNKEIAFDQLVLKLIQHAGSGGTGSSQPGGGSSSSTTPNNNNSGNSSGQSNTPRGTASSGGGSEGGGGGGCSIASVPHVDACYAWLLCIISLLYYAFRVRMRLYSE